MAEMTRLLSPSETIHLAWEKTFGAKKTIWAALIVMCIILLLLAIGVAILGTILFDTTLRTQNRFQMISGTIIQVIAYVFQMGILLIGIKRANDHPIHYRQMFSTFRPEIIIKLIGFYLLEVIIMLLIFSPVMLISLLLDSITADISKDFFTGLFIVIAVLVSIYVLLRMYLAPAFIIDKKFNPWKAIQLSFGATRSNPLRLLIVIILQIIFITISIIPLGIGLIWSIPFCVICYGVIYHTLLPNAYPEALS